MLANGWLFASWVVGASRIRDVEAGWPAAGTKIHHSVGAWPLLLNDETEVQGSDPGRFLKLIARTRPFGESCVELELVPRGTGVTIVMREDAISGPISTVPQVLRRAALRPRNAETLRRLAFIAEGGGC